MSIPAIGAWVGGLGLATSEDSRRVARELEQLGYGVLWVAEAMAKEAFTNASVLLAATERTILATGIANIWVRDATAMVNASRTLGEAYPGRFLLGMGVSHQPLVERRGHLYESPLDAMRQYLDAMGAARYHGPLPTPEPPRVLGALGPRMVQLAAERTDGVHSYLVVPDHTRAVREALGPDKLLAPVVTVLVSDEPASAREVARRHLKLYLGLENYRRHLVRQGFTDADLDHGGSDRLVDALVGWGSVDDVLRRIDEHSEAGADHVAVNALADNLDALTMQLRALAPGLADLDRDEAVR